MREIKFRAWDKKYKKMYEGDIKIALAFPDKDVEVMQYTGLRDKNGKEIYEGDIAWSDGHQLQFIVEYQLSMAGFMLCSNGLSMGVGQNAYVMEIIGNIYENPELLDTPDNALITNPQL